MSPKTPSELEAENLEDKQLKGYTPDSWYRRAGKKLHQNRYIYWLYGFFDFISLYNSMLKLILQEAFEGVKKNTDNVLHQVLNNPVTFAANVIFIFFASVLSAFGNYFEDDDKNFWKKSLAILVPYARIFIKSLKNSYKGIGSFIKTASYFGLRWAPHAFMAGFGLGFIAGFNDWVNRYLVQNRKTQQDYNKQLTQDLVLGTISLETFQRTQLAPMRHSTAKRILALFTALFGGFSTSFYFYFGTFIIVSPLFFIPPVLPFTTLVFCTFAISNVITRLNEEWIFQGRHEVSALNVDIEVKKLIIKETLEKISKLERNFQIKPSVELRNEIGECKKQLYNEMAQYLTLRDKRQNKLRRSIFSAFFVGVKNGLTMYSTVSILVFVVPVLMSLLAISTAGAPLVLPIIALITIGMGVTAVVSFSWWSVLKNHLHNYFEKKSREKTQLSNINSLKSREFSEVKQTILNELDGVIVVPPPSIDGVYGKAEIERSFVSANSKGWKAIPDLLLTPAKNKVWDDDGSYSYTDPKAVQVIAIASGFLFGIVNLLRVFARSFGKTPPELDLIPPKAKVPPKPIATSNVKSVVRVESTSNLKKETANVDRNSLSDTPPVLQSTGSIMQQLSPLRSLSLPSLPSVSPSLNNSSSSVGSDTSISSDINNESHKVNISKVPPTYSLKSGPGLNSTSSIGRGNSIFGLGEYTKNSPLNIPSYVG